jgi:hypothetical protein
MSREQGGREESGRRGRGGPRFFRLIWRTTRKAIKSPLLKAMRKMESEVKREKEAESEERSRARESDSTRPGAKDHRIGFDQTCKLIRCLRFPCFGSASQHQLKINLRSALIQ